MAFALSTPVKTGSRLRFPCGWAGGFDNDAYGPVGHAI
jgi:hypothetical protein